MYILRKNRQVRRPVLQNSTGISLNIQLHYYGAVNSSLIIRNFHIAIFLGGNIWIIGSRAPAKSLILDSVICARYRRHRTQQLMGATIQDAGPPHHHPSLTLGSIKQEHSSTHRRGVNSNHTSAVFVCSHGIICHQLFIYTWSVTTHRMVFITAYIWFNSKGRVPSQHFSTRKLNVVQFSHQ